MRTILLGTDFMYNSLGNLIPVEINTNLGMNVNNLEDDNEIFNLTSLRNFLIEKSFTKVTYIGALKLFNEKLSPLCNELEIVYTFILKSDGITIPYIEDDDTHLIIRSAYDSTAIIDEEYCKDKVNFLNLIKNSSFGTQFAYINEFGVLVNNITTIPDNGVHPNFILKSSTPRYDFQNYPKLFRVTNQSELNVLLQNVDSTHFLMQYHFNPNKLYLDHIQVFRSMNILFPPDLNSIPVGQYTKLTERTILENPVYNSTTFELDISFKYQYLSKDGYIDQPKLLDTDLVEMADGTFKTAVDLAVGDHIKSVILPNPDDVDLYSDIYDYAVPYEVFATGSTYTTNTITEKWRVDKLVEYIKITFTDETDWEDTANSNYLICRDEIVRFAPLKSEDIHTLKEGDDVILIDTTNQSVVNSVRKTVANIEITKTIFSGWEIVVEEQHLFLTQTSSTDPDNISYATIEHNPTFCSSPNCSSKGCGSYVCCYGVCRSFATCAPCIV